MFSLRRRIRSSADNANSSVAHAADPEADVESLIAVESKRLRSSFMGLCIACVPFVVAVHLAVAGFALMVSGTSGTFIIVELFTGYLGTMNRWAAAWPTGLDPLAAGLAITSLSVAMVVAVAVVRLPSRFTLREGQATVEEHVRQEHLVKTARLVTICSGLLLFILASVLVWGGGYRAICAAVLVLLALLCLRLSCAVPIPETDWEQYRKEEQRDLEKVNEEAQRMKQQVAGRGGAVAHPRWRLTARLILSSMVIGSVIALGSGMWALTQRGSLTAVELIVMSQAFAFFMILSLYLQSVAVWALYSFPAPQYDERHMTWYRLGINICCWLLVIVSLLALALGVDRGDFSAPYLFVLFVFLIVFVSPILCSAHVAFLRYKSRAWLTLRDRRLQSKGKGIADDLSRYKGYLEAREPTPPRRPVHFRKSHSRLLCAQPWRRSS